MIAILDYGAGNLRSVENTLAEIGAPYRLVRDAEGLRGASRIVLPGVGHFGQMMRAQDAMQVRGAPRLLRGLDPGAFVYFAHSYYVPEVEATAATCTYAVPYTAVLESANVYGVQFHPEKSGPVGLRIVRNFLDP